MGNLGPLSYVTPYENSQHGEAVLHPAEMKIIEHADGVIEVHDPLFEAPYRFGDRSLVSDPTADEYVVATWRHHLVGMSTRQLSNTETFETKAGTGRWSRQQHMLSTAAMTALDHGTPLEIMQMVTHDAGHIVGSHQADDLLMARGHENAHDGRLLTLARRNSFIDRLLETGLIDAAGNFSNLDAHIDDVLDLSRTPNSHISWPGTTGCLEQERKQYLGHEGAIWGFGAATMREALTHLRRLPDTPHGDHLVFDDVDAAIIYSVSQIRCVSEHWEEPPNDIIDELLITAHRRMFTSHDPAMRDINRYHVADAMNVLEEDWLQLRQDLADRDPFMAVMLKLATRLAAQQRDVHAALDAYQNSYTGPILPDWLTLQQSILPPEGCAQRIVHGRAKNIAGNTIVLEMQPGKMRTLNPWVTVPGQDMRRLETVAPWLTGFRQERTRWCGKPYDALIDLDHPALAVTKVEKRALKRGLQRILAAWPAVLERPDMPDDMLAEQVRQAGITYREIGRLGTMTADLELAAVS